MCFGLTASVFCVMSKQMIKEKEYVCRQRHLWPTKSNCTQSLNPTSTTSHDEGGQRCEEEENANRILNYLVWIFIHLIYITNRFPRNSHFANDDDVCSKWSYVCVCVCVYALFRQKKKYRVRTACNHSRPNKIIWKIWKDNSIHINKYWNLGCNAPEKGSNEIHHFALKLTHTFPWNFKPLPILLFVLYFFSPVLRPSSVDFSVFIHNCRAMNLLDEFLCFEVSSQVQHLPGGETQQTAHTEYAEEQYTAVCRFCGRREKKCGLIEFQRPFI